ncbi:MAG: GNAT family N-acetyltransferase [Chloroflexi bacterium]|nr:GNAT family N-acetyltransferase [Chloroflexota bacterium]
MSSDRATDSKLQLTLRPVNSENWRQVAALKVTAEQGQFVAEPTYYLALCCYGTIWQPLAIYVAEQVVGFIMWGVDPADGSCWFGGFIIDQPYQGRGYGRQALQTAMTMLAREHGYQQFALSYQPANGARHLYHTLGFVETDEWVDDEVVARLTFSDEVGAVGA